MTCRQESKRSDSTAAKIAQEPALELEEKPQHLGNREDHLAVRDIEKECCPHPLPPFLQTLGMARRAKTPGLAGKHQKVFRPAARTADPRKSAARIAAIEIALDDLLDDGAQIAVGLLETLLVLRQEALKMMEQHPVENGPLRTARTIDARHIGNKESRNAPVFENQESAISPRQKGKSPSPGLTTKVDVITLYEETDGAARFQKPIPILFPYGYALVIRGLAFS
jgi:hypothetical protein